MSLGLGLVFATSCLSLLFGVSATFFAQAFLVVTFHHFSKPIVLGGEVFPVFGQDLVQRARKVGSGFPDLHLGERLYVAADRLWDAEIAAGGVCGILDWPGRPRIDEELPLSPRSLDPLYESLIDDVDEPIGGSVWLQASCFGECRNCHTAAEAAQDLKRFPLCRS